MMTDDFCEDCIHLLTLENESNCDLGYWGRLSLKEYHANLWRYWNEREDIIVPYFPVGEYEDDDDWEVLAVRPNHCKSSDAKEVV